MSASGKFLLDTNIVIALLEGEVAAASYLNEEVEIYLPRVVLGELYFGAAKSGRPTENASRLDRFTVGWAVLPSDRSVAREYGTLKNQLKMKGRPIPENDIWIAAVARHHGMVLVTRDDHFREVDGLLIENWIAAA